jgi:predicted RNase H-like HicB family nuclease
MDYIAYLHKDRTSDFGVSFPDFPGCVTAGRTLEEARRMAAEALRLHVGGMIEDGQAIPEPSTLDDLADDPAMVGAFAVVIPLESPERTVRVNITARESQIEEIDRRAKRAGLTRSAYMVRSAIAGIPGLGQPARRGKVRKIARAKPL